MPRVKGAAAYNKGRVNAALNTGSVEVAKGHRLIANYLAGLVRTADEGTGHLALAAVGCPPIDKWDGRRLPTAASLCISHPLGEHTGTLGHPKVGFQMVMERMLAQALWPNPEDTRAVYTLSK